MAARPAPEPSILLHESRLPGESGSRLFTGLVDVIAAETPSDVGRAFARIEQALARGHFVAGAAAYELGYCFEDRLLPLFRAPGQPLLQFGVFRRMQTLDEAGAEAVIAERAIEAGDNAVSVVPLETRERYVAKVVRIRDYIAAGDIYQANLTFPLRFPWRGDVWSLYRRLAPLQRVLYGAVIDLPSLKVASLSPELFLRKDGSTLTSRPMKGTMRRGADAAEDRSLATRLHGDAKNRAENLMIVDLIRNDLSRMARIGSVLVEGLFSIETYETLHQMVSTVKADVDPAIPLLDVFRAMFPCGSITGAPKIRAMEVIRELEDHARGIYTGAVGYISPERNLVFSVPIRTAELRQGEASFGIGSGIVWDSVPEEEFEECLLKAQFLTTALT